MKVALVHERLTEIAGSENVVAELAKEWPDATVDIPIVVPGNSTSDRIQEVHIKVLHIVIEAVERRLFPDLSCCCVTYRFAAIDVSGWNAVIPVLVSGVQPSQHQDLPIAHEEHMHSGYDFEPFLSHALYSN